VRNIHATYKVTTQPTLEPITLGELKTRLRITVDEFDDELYDLLRAGREAVEYDSHRYLVTQTVAMYLDRFPVSSRHIEIRKLPVASVTSVTYIDEDVASQTFASSKYVTDLDGKPPRIQLLENQDWPDTEIDYVKAVTVTFVAGSAAEAVPVEAKLAIVEWVRMHWGKCDGDHGKYQALINRLAWSGHWMAV